MTDDSAEIRNILSRVRTIAVIGASARPERPSHDVSAFLQRSGYRVIPVNPGLAGQRLLGETVRARPGDVPEEVDMVDIFRRSEAVAGIVEAALARWPRLPVIWTQLGVRDDAAAARARARGVTVIQDRCPKIELLRGA